MADRQTVIGACFLQSGQEIVKVGQRLAHPHDDDVAEPLVAGQQALEAEHLLDDLAGRQIPLDAVQAARAKNAAHCTADLRADANAAALAIAEEYTLDPPAAVVGRGSPDPVVG